MAAAPAAAAAGKGSEAAILAHQAEAGCQGSERTGRKANPQDSGPGPGQRQRPGPGGAGVGAAVPSCLTPGNSSDYFLEVGATCHFIVRWIKSVSWYWDSIGTNTGRLSCASCACMPKHENLFRIDLQKKEK
jgi:hypothetical protein